MEIMIRGIEEGDYPAVTDLFTHQILGNGRSDEYRGAVERFFRLSGEDGNYSTFVAVAGRRVVGFISAVRMMWIGSSCMFVQCLAVRETYQRRGIGTKLLGFLESYAAEQGIAGIGLQSGVQRAGAHAFYARCGYIRSNYCYKNFPA